MAYQVRSGRNGYRESFMGRLNISGIFVVLFMLSALRFGIGNDYYQYAQTAHEASVGGYVVTEVGFNWLVRFVYAVFGGEYYEVVFAVFAFATLTIFLKAFIRLSDSFFMSFLLFMTFGLYFQTFNTVRYYLALSIALYSMRYLMEKDYIKFVVVIFVAAFFHKSVLLVIPVYMLATLSWKKWQIILGVVLGAFCYLGRDILLKAALVLYPSYKNTVYLEGGTSITAIIRTVAVLALYVWFMRYNKSHGEYNTDRIRFFGQLNMLALVAATFFSFLPVVTRIVYYFSVSQLIMIPEIIEKIDDLKLKKRLCIGLMAFCAAYFAIFLLGAHQDGVRLLPYRTWLFESERYIF
jgi:hypothetical protein